MWISPSTPPRSTNTPKSVMLVTVPCDALSGMQGMEQLGALAGLGLGCPFRKHNAPVFRYTLDDLKPQRSANVGLHGFLAVRYIDLSRHIHQDERTGQIRRDSRLPPAIRPDCSRTP